MRSFFGFLPCHFGTGLRPAASERAGYHAKAQNAADGGSEGKSNSLVIVGLKAQAERTETAFKTRFM